MLWVLGFIGILLVAAYVWYAMIVTRRNRVSEALAGVDVQLQQRHDLIPNVLTIARRFMEHERALLEEITALRNEANAQAGNRDFSAAAQRFATEKRLEADMGRLFALAENYPQLQSQGPMMEAQRAYSEVEANLSAARRFYNAAVGDLRNIVEIFPGSLLKGAAGVTVLPPFFEAAEPVRSPVDAARYLEVRP
jgi:LemA protein